MSVAKCCDKDLELETEIAQVRGQVSGFFVRLLDCLTAWFCLCA